MNPEGLSMRYACSEGLPSRRALPATLPHKGGWICTERFVWIREKHVNAYLPLTREVSPQGDERRDELSREYKQSLSLGKPRQPPLHKGASVCASQKPSP